MLTLGQPIDYGITEPELLIRVIHFFLHFFNSRLKNIVVLCYYFLKL